jgi:hypothetical protein
MAKMLRELFISSFHDSMRESSSMSLRRWTILYKIFFLISPPFINHSAPKARTNNRREVMGGFRRDPSLERHR